MTNLRQTTLFDAEIAADDATKRGNRQQLDRVSNNIRDVIQSFFASLRGGQEFRASDLHEYVESQCSVAPGSADRVMREMRANGLIGYELVSRSESLYRKVQ